MKKWYPEHYKFKITVMSVGDDGNPQHCRNGHEVGDTYECGYGCPGGFCSKTASRLFTIQEAVRSGGDLRLLIYKADKNSCVFPCADHVVTFKFEAELNFAIEPLNKEHLPIYADVIRKSFSTVAQDFGWTKENAHGHVSFRTDDQLASKQEDGYYPFGLFVDKTLVGFVSLTDMGNGSYELNKLSVLPSWRHIGYGKKLLDFCKDKVRELGGNKITLDLIDENTILKNWYAANGFVHTGTKKFKHLPFTTGFMEWEATK
ncbi:MAG: GNAT family N-acetyltransferase [Eubacteriales bacterium]|nr:GNAT family N-acetyltransferase [Eubacteriales bacterium]